MLEFEIITSITKNINSIFKEGCCCLFDTNVNMTFHTKADNETRECKSRDLWVTDFVVMLNANKIALAVTTKEIGK